MTILESNSGESALMIRIMAALSISGLSSSSAGFTFSALMKIILS
ncbi:hypothetical protein ACYUJ6_16395 [Clostridium sp. JNZ X4-2]